MRVISESAFCTEVPSFYLVEGLRVLADVACTCEEACLGNEACACEWTECFNCREAAAERAALALVRVGQ